MVLAITLCDIVTHKVSKLATQSNLKYDVSNIEFDQGIRKANGTESIKSRV